MGEPVKTLHTSSANVLIAPAHKKERRRFFIILERFQKVGRGNNSNVISTDYEDGVALITSGEMSM